ncbi:acyltransferase [Aureimonas glaciei]|uniref:Acyltransferase n=2 Tax=Aureimonas glaciei TaxID=1776957 RepID=A0A916XZT0_9HYPH|nr:acyltransferase [Aureimonas glaciei]
MPQASHDFERTVSGVATSTHPKPFSYPSIAPRPTEADKRLHSKDGLTMGRTQKLDALTGLRFFAAATIVVHHVRGTLGVPAEFFANSDFSQGVSIFFVLSGFILIFANRELKSWAETGAFYVKRIARIWPSHFVVLMAALAIGFPIVQGPFLANLALIQAWNPVGDYFFSYNAVSWSISTELGFYLAFPLLLYRFERTWFWKLPLTLIIALSMPAYASWIDAPFYGAGVTGPVVQGFVMTSPLARLFEFTLGMSAGHLWVKHLSGRHIPSLVAWIAEPLAAALLFYDVTIFLPRILQMLPETSAFSFWAIMAAVPAIPSALAIIVLASGKGPISWLLSRRPIVYLGEISFAIYLTHQLIQTWFRQHEASFAGLPEGALIALYVCTVAACSVALYHVVERPCQRAAKAAIGYSRRIPRTAAADAPTA